MHITNKWTTLNITLDISTSKFNTGKIMDDHEINNENIKNISFQMLLFIHNLRDDDKIIEIFEAGDIHNVSKSKIKRWRTNPSTHENGSIMPNVCFYGFLWGLKALQLEEKLTIQHDA